MKFIMKTIKFTVILVFLGIIVLAGLYGYAKISPKLTIKNSSSIYMYTATDDLFYQSNGTSSWVSIDNINENLIHATLSVEDKNFYKHQGFDYLRLASAMTTNIMTMSKKEGASTITQQYAKILYLTYNKTWKRKIEEAWITMRIESHYTKDEILEGYLNTINYNHGAYGIENASKYYFNKSAKDLTLAESSMLAGIPKAPSHYSPLVNYEKAKSRQKIILELMRKNGYITEEEKNDAYNEELEFYSKWNDYDLDTLQYYSDAVSKELESLDVIPTSLIENGGIKIYTYLDLDTQKNLEKNIKKELKDKDLQSASIVMNPNNGSVIALAGGKDFKESEFNRAVSSKRQIGSTIKPFLYYGALEAGFTPSTTFLSEKTTFTFAKSKTYSPNNYNNKYPNKDITLLTALTYSDNIYAVKTHLFLGQDTLVNTLNRAGIDSVRETNPSLALGAEEINMMELIEGYASFANGGYKINPHLISKIEDKNGKVLYENKESKELIFNKSNVFILNEIMSNCYSYKMVDYSSPTCLSIAPRLTNKYAIKTGSTDADSWIVGYNNNLITAVWTGYDDNTDLKSGDSGHSRIIWAEVMENYFSKNEATWYEIPSNVSGVIIDPKTGYAATKNDKSNTVMYYVKGSEPNTIKEDNDMEAVFKEMNENN
ncbi:MAG: transglycosylase domain-containing protein [Bacilli bacterium]